MSSKAIRLVNVSRSYTRAGVRLVVLDGLDLTIEAGSFCALMGPSGSGKTTLLNLIGGLDRADSGEVWVGPSIRLGRYTQEHQSLDPGSTPVDVVRHAKPMYEEQAYGFLGRFLFNYEHARRPVSTLSGGEKARLQLACLMLSGANCLLLDEPTNNLDIAGAEVLEHALETYTGTVIVISHDRYFLDRVVDRIWELKDGRLREFEDRVEHTLGDHDQAHHQRKSALTVREAPARTAYDGEPGRQRPPRDGGAGHQDVAECREQHADGREDHGPYRARTPPSSHDSSHPRIQGLGRTCRWTRTRCTLRRHVRMLGPF